MGSILHLRDRIRARPMLARSKDRARRTPRFKRLAPHAYAREPGAPHAHPHAPHSPHATGRRAEGGVITEFLGVPAPLKIP